MLAPKFLLLLFTLFLGVVFARDATGLSPYDKRDLQARQEGIRLWIERDETLRPQGREDRGHNDVFYWSGIARFAEQPNDQQLVDMTHDAHVLMRQRWEEENIDLQNRPMVMTGLSVGKAVFFASSVKGSPPAVYFQRNGNGGIKNNQVPQSLSNALTTCFTEGGGQHRSTASCGEVMAAWTFFMSPMSRNTHNSLRGVGAKAVAWAYKNDGRGRRPFDRMIPPCGEDETERGWGCHRLLETLGVRAVPTMEASDEAYQPPNSVGHLQARGIYHHRG